MKKKSIHAAASEDLVSTTLTHLKNGQIEQAVAAFADRFQFHDFGLGLEFTGKEELTEFLQRRREDYPGSLLMTESVFTRDDYVITEWRLETTVQERFWGGQSRNEAVSIRGASFVRTETGKITRWSEYYDSLTARRTKPPLSSCEMCALLDGLE